MGTKLIKLQDGTLVEVEASPNEVEQIASIDYAKEVQESIEKIKPILLKVCRPVISVWQELNKEMMIEQAEVELGLAFEAEGNLYVTKAKAGANVNVKLTLKPKENENS
ncbi:hypothetical protein U27_03684 [Candidatus Vecturithrix granuli]|uniref:Trypsin-co-occurring domain-containing protein n=1 Tax=Vecturithrix granuli TaxID=1499967 RepID=A0A081BWL6_VECG1|nr:hypothetical protein U27_03684 [Candidatus Vecturithrix granuli]